jgi:hypothetical protein
MFTDIPTEDAWRPHDEHLRTLWFVKKRLLLDIKQQLRWYPNRPSKYAALLRLRECADTLVSQLGGRSSTVVTSRGKAAVALRDIVQKKLNELEKLTTAKYYKVAFIGYDLQMAELDKGYYGSTNDELDLEARWAEMSGAIAKAHWVHKVLLDRPFGTDGRWWPAEDDPRTLKVFMAPEFYFRGKRGAYEIGILFDLLEKVRTVTGSQDFKDWLFVLGTCVCATAKTTITGTPKVALDQSPPLDWKETTEGVELQNYAIVQKGGFPGSDGIHDLQVLKEFPSKVDFRHTNQNWHTEGRTVELIDQGSGEANFPRAVVQPDSREFEARRNDGTPNRRVSEKSPLGCIFAMDGITFGLEVCRDHDRKRLAIAKDRSGVQLQLITSCGLLPQPAACVGNAIAFHVDGQFGYSWLRGADGVEVKGKESNRAYPFDVKNPVIFPPVKIPLKDSFRTTYDLRFWKPLPIPRVV